MIGFFNFNENLFKVRNPIFFFKKKNCVSNLQPDYNKIPKSNHPNLRWRVPNPSPTVFDSDHIHEGKDVFHRHKTNDETDEIHYCGIGFYFQRPSALEKRES